eukprot:CAMPEP_0175993200 /NCGR_PEP_ID=MMETSP0108-20121206/53833_1 /TAXON_ID=195067 ORGANISM="Goniomonas pacifica, Strain CCMP1869" /NCGR_SAMPLE_ID=MMETSP0108 /ASSEMBLY_ACC=CAM_ASM_000204 /LENGTH=119 /DNA_ID=CAMNT_0017324963 /DNA_START=171 /DNA_END=531 /DNA_ORIENTATION=-
MMQIPQHIPKVSLEKGCALRQSSMLLGGVPLQDSAESIIGVCPTSSFLYQAQSLVEFEVFVTYQVGDDDGNTAEAPALQCTRMPPLLRPSEMNWSVSGSTRSRSAQASSSGSSSIATTR